MTDAGLEHLNGLNRLRTLVLRYTRVTDAGLQYLEKLSRLKTVDLTDAKVTAAGVRRLKSALPKLHVTRR